VVRSVFSVTGFEGSQGEMQVQLGNSLWRAAQSVYALHIVRLLHSAGPHLGENIVGVTDRTLRRRRDSLTHLTLNILARRHGTWHLKKDLE
jgi:hypothetical protein